ncbi:MAG: hypothetical protein J6Y43_07260, partial [Clostridia bacterium]|nr:hypothetical protein [Clostridia bacterium]
VPEGQIFYLGDNRARSADSRSAFGPCEEKQIVGVVGDFALKTKGINKFFDKISGAIKKIFSF